MINVKSVLALLAFGGALSSCMQVSPRAEALSKQQGSAANGQALYEASCADCHGADGRGTDKTVSGGITISLPKSGAYHSAAETLTYIIDGIPDTTMGGYGAWSDQDLLDVYAYIHALPK
jgi:mono/diheme cytochrome c family protein